MITNRDKRIIKFIEEYGSITINQCSKMFFRNNKERYDQARKRLQVIHKAGHLKKYRRDPRSEAIYYIEKRLKVHDLKLLDVLGELNEFRVHLCTKEKQIVIGENKYILDGAVVLDIDSTLIPVLIEIDYTHYTSMEKITNVIYYLEKKHKRSYHFIVVKLTQEEIEMKKVGEFSKVFFLPWNLDQFSEIIPSLRSAVDKTKASNNQ